MTTTTPTTATKSFIETQFPVSKLSKESYKERSAGSGQTLTGLGKWWGRKPLVLVRACILGLLMPAGDDPKRDREVFLKLMTMDEDGLWQRYQANGMSLKQVDIYNLLDEHEREGYFVLVTDSDKEAQWKRGLSREEKADAHRLAFEKLNYDDKLKHCVRPEEIDGPSEDAWADINAHLGTSSTTLQELVAELGHRRFGRVPRVGDAFCGGGSIPFEAARLGCEAYGSDLNPVAALLTWAALHIVGGSTKVCEEVKASQVETYLALEASLLEYETNELGMRADAFLYCNEVRDPMTGWSVPLAPSWLVAPKYAVVCELVPRPDTKSFEIEVIQGAKLSQVEAAKENATAKDGVICPVDALGNPLTPRQRLRTRLDDIRGPQGLRRWENDDIVPRPTDVFQERLYCIKWRIPTLERLLCAEQVLESGENAPGVNLNLNQVRGTLALVLPLLAHDDRRYVDLARTLEWRGAAHGILTAYAGFGDIDEDDEDAAELVKELRRDLASARKLLPKELADLAKVTKRAPRYLYRAPDEGDLMREQQVLDLVRERFADWQAKGFIPSMRIEPGAETTRLGRERGYTHWHHLFNPRQLLLHGLLSEGLSKCENKEISVGLLSLLGRLCDWNSRLSLWLPPQSGGTGGVMNTFMNMALNTTVVFGARGSAGVRSALLNPSSHSCHAATVQVGDARELNGLFDILITDPPYADAINYEELSEFYLAWYSAHIQRLFPEWYTDSRRVLAVKGSGTDFMRSMVQSYSRFGEVTDKGIQTLMFTHSSADVWADLALIIWASELQVTGAWCISTEKSSGLREGNYIQGTVNLVIRKRDGNKTAWRSDVLPEIQSEVQRQLISMLALEDSDDPNFSDSDFQLAAYAAALQVLTQYARIEDLDVQKELQRLQPEKGVVKERRKEKNPIVELIDEAVRIASDYLVPKNIDRQLWRTLRPMERLYVKGLEVESHGDYRNGVYMEFARGFGVRDYKPILADTKANQTRLKTPTEFASRDLRGGDFADTLLRQVLFAVHKTAQEEDPRPGRDWLRQEVTGYWDHRQTILGLLDYLAQTPTTAMEHWTKDAAAAQLLRGMVENDSV